MLVMLCHVIELDLFTVKDFSGLVVDLGKTQYSTM